MNILMEPACYAWAGEGSSATYPSQEFERGVLWLDSFFSWNRHCRVPMTADLRAAISRVFPYEAAAVAGRVGQAQELVGLITRLVDRVRVMPDNEYLEAELTSAGLLDRRAAVYRDDDVWLSWCDLLAQSVVDSDARSEHLNAFLAWVDSCVRSDTEDWARTAVRWILGDRDPLPDGTVDPRAMETMKGRWKRSKRPTVWEDSGHQPPVAIKRLVARVVDDCEGVVVRFGSTYFNPALPSRCAVSGCGTDGDGVSQLDCCISDGGVTVRGVFRTTAETPQEQAAALSFVRRRMRDRCDETGFEFSL